MNIYKSIKVYLLVIIIAIITMAANCNKPPAYPETPVIKYLSIQNNPYNIKNDSAILKFSFTDGDGDISYVNGDVTPGDTNMYLTQIRPNSTFAPYVYELSLPYIPAKGSYKQLSGVVSIKLNEYCTCRPDHLIADTVQFKVKIKDLAGHVSNEITTDELIIHCQ